MIKISCSKTRFRRQLSVCYSLSCFETVKVFENELRSQPNFCQIETQVEAVNENGKLVFEVTGECKM